MSRGVAHGRDRLGDWTALLVIALMWGTAFAFIRLAVASVSPLGVAAGRIVVAAVVLCAALRLVGLCFPPLGRIWLHFLVLGIVGNALPFYLISWGQQTVPSGVAGILMGTNPLVTLVLAHFLVRGEPLTPLRAAGFAVGFAGVVVLMGPEALGALGGDLPRQGGILAGALCYATNTILTRRMPETHPLVASACVLLVASTLIVPAAILAPGPGTAATGASLLAVVWLGLVPTAAATILYFRVVSSAGPTFLSLVNFPVPVLAVLTGALVYGERPGSRALVALALILAGITLTQLRGAGRSPPGLPAR